MARPAVVNKSTDPFDVYIGRGSVWGNPYRIKSGQPRAVVIKKFERYLLQQLHSGKISRSELDGLSGKRLGCHCAPLACHGDVIADFVEQSVSQ